MKNEEVTILKENKTLDLGKTNINKIFWIYAIPSILMMIVQSTAAFIDSVFVGRYVGADGLAAITLVTPLIMLMIGLGAMIAVGGTTLAGIEKGAENFKKSNNLFNVTLSLMLVAGFIGTLVIYIMVPVLARLTGAQGVVLTQTVEYATYISYFISIFLLNYVFGFFLKLDGKPVAVVLIMLSGMIVNIVLDYLFIAKFSMGIRGAALATGASQALPFFMFLGFVVFRSSWRIKKPEFHLNEIGQIFFNGMSEFLSNIALSLTGILFNYIIMRRIGSDGVAAYAIALQLAGIVVSIGYGVAEGSQVAISYNFGAEQYSRVKTIRNLSLKVNFILGILLCIASLLFGNELAGIFVKEGEIIHIATEILSYYAIAFIFIGININIGTYYTAINDPVRSAVVTIYRSLVATIIGLALLPLIFGSKGIWLTILFVEISTLCIGFLVLKRNPFGNVKSEKIL
ncbi:MATE family efflux transporter [Candidatus Contubernalis alkaliaceticus]|uniref:MATE family efflux transporter n=1 Tax=Candidatus Contubernalis alkaliaceticus TaxID=338645 RepID=UPI001F4C1650|nr:MATE family efflux transporter [Candidatus Contubernalis alkalaceticus]UNC93228.1 MATE family efflux transporter [Candidatus Contubernalis alkalaceticus]